MSWNRIFGLVVCVMVFGVKQVCAARAVAPFDVAVAVETGLGEQADEQIAAALTTEVQKLVYLTAAQRRALADQKPGHQLRVRYKGQTRAGAIQEFPAARQGSPSRFTIDYASRGRLECTLVAQQDGAEETVQSWEGAFRDAETLSLGRSKQDAAHLRRMARQVILARLTVQLAEAVRTSASDRFWPVRVEDISPDAHGTVTGRLILANRSPWPMEFTPEVRGEVVNPDKPKPSRWHYLFQYPKKRLGKIVVQPGETVEHGFELALSPATPEQIAAGRIIETTFRDFAFEATLWRVRWQPGPGPVAPPEPEEVVVAAEQTEGPGDTDEPDANRGAGDDKR